MAETEKDDLCSLSNGVTATMVKEEVDANASTRTNSKAGSAFGLLEHFRESIVQIFRVQSCS